MNAFICPNESCEQHETPVYTAEPQNDNECGSCGEHGSTIVVDLDE